jgi:hypothetical protein
MLTSHHVLPEPDRLTIGADGVLTGRTGQYVKVLRDLAGVYHDAGAFRTAVDERGQDQMAYRVEEHRYGDGPGALNVGDEPFVTLFCYAADAGQDYAIISRAGGMAQLVVSDDAGGWTTRPNPNHVGYRQVTT